jgi:hypothetical protein
LRDIKAPRGYYTSQGNPWTHQGSMNASDWIDFLGKYAIYVMDGIFEKKDEDFRDEGFGISKSYADKLNDVTNRMINMFRLLMRKKHKKSELANMKRLVIETLDAWDQTAPFIVKPRILHLLIHTIDDLQRYASAYNTWMFPFERMLGES